MLLTAYSDIDAAIKAINDAHLDHYLSKPWDPPEERLFPVIDDLLDAWQAEYLPEAKGLRLVGHQWSPRSHAIKDFLAGNLIPYRWLDVDAQPRYAQACSTRPASSASELPALFFEDGSVLRNPEPRQVAERLGRSLSAAARPVRPRDRRRRPGRPGGGGVRRVRRVCGRCCSIGTRRAGRRAAVRGSRTISAFPPASAAAS